MRTKAGIRSEVRARRQEMPAAARKRASAQVCSRLRDLPAFGRARMVAFYVALKGEVDLTPCVVECRELGMRVCVPAWSAAARRYGFALMRQNEPLTVGPMQVPQPAWPEWVPLTMLDVVVAPGLAFDILGNRIGFGGGHYDRLLSRCSIGCARIGVAFDWQIRRHVPFSERDQKMHWVVTETRTLKCV